MQNINRQRITAEAGQDSVTLPCGAGKEKEITALEWSRPDLDPDVVFLYIDGHFHPDRLHPSFRNRVDLLNRRMKDGDASLVLKDLKINDTGTYECEVIQGGGGQKMITTIHLVVSSPPAHTCFSPAGTREGGGNQARGDKEGGSLGLTLLVFLGDCVPASKSSLLSPSGHLEASAAHPLSRRSSTLSAWTFPSTRTGAADSWTLGGSKQPVSVATAPPLQAEPGLDDDYDDVTTEHHF
ncbi:unnamed protein product [Menidia menidia]|uniref:(Atlantic silverside) hypothetical protein n=1 Tax=Menidia menidia TaxID=238744 RepID=A0A8S4BEB7_9TELE|nr:unnamed protein product [Menidia menidia]